MLFVLLKRTKRKSGQYKGLNHKLHSNGQNLSYIKQHLSIGYIPKFEGKSNKKVSDIFSCRPVFCIYLTQNFILLILVD